MNFLNKSELKKSVKELGQFPYKRRKRNYQSYYLGNQYESGSRNTLYRLDSMQIPMNVTGKSVLDLGCQIGALCTEMHLRGAGRVLGLDHRDDYIFCAEEVAKYNKHKIEYKQMDLCDIPKVVSFLNGEQFDIVFLLSMYKHLKGKGFDLLKRLKWKFAYVESNNCPNGYESKQAKMMESCMSYWSIQRLGIIDDRGRRCLWRIYV
jgi:2-polyprenyl-3-methyl-5-hydroxy-6-metoxy-1,4-benzoquinol methylase